jgi:hypothetical protein
VDVRHHLLGPHHASLVGGPDHGREQIIAEVVALPRRDLVDVLGEACGRREVILQLLVGQERVDELQALPRPRAELGRVIDLRDPEQITRQAIRQLEADLLDHPPLGTVALAGERGVDDRLRALPVALHGAVGERRRDEPSRLRVRRSVGPERVVGEMDIAVRSLGLAPQHVREPDLDIVVGEHEPAAAPRVYVHRTLRAQRGEVGVGIRQVLGRVGSERRRAHNRLHHCLPHVRPNH